MPTQPPSLQPRAALEEAWHKHEAWSGSQEADLQSSAASPMGRLLCPAPGLSHQGFWGMLPAGVSPPQRSVSWAAGAGLALRALPTNMGWVSQGLPGRAGMEEHPWRKRGEPGSATLSSEVCGIPPLLLGFRKPHSPNLQGTWAWKDTGQRRREAAPDSAESCSGTGPPSSGSLLATGTRTWGATRRQACVELRVLPLGPCPPATW